MRKKRTWGMGQSPEKTEDRRQRSEAIKHRYRAED
jgi:hypothetical protein